MASRERHCGPSARPTVSVAGTSDNVGGKVELRGNVGESMCLGASVMMGVLAGPGCMVMIPLSGRMGEPSASRVWFG